VALQAGISLESEDVAVDNGLDMPN
jgi:hypothetical protein